jgi:hypothetical protein
MASAVLVWGDGEVVRKIPVGTPSVDDILAHLARADAAKRAELIGFSVPRRYVLHNSRLSQDAQMWVRASYRQGEGKSFEILKTEHAEGLTRRVFQRVLDGEVDASRSGQVEHERLTRDNYNFEFLGQENGSGRLCYVLALHPKHKAKYLIEGKAWIDANEYALVKVEGHPTASVSFIAGKPLMLYEFGKCGNFWMSVFHRSIAESLLFGETELTIEYGKYEFTTQSAASILFRAPMAR